MVGDVAVRGDVRIDEVTREADVRASVAVHSILGTLLQKQPHCVHLLQADHHTLALYFPPFLAVVIVGNGLHLLSVLHQYHREHFLWKFPHRKGEIVSPGDAAAVVTGVWIEVPSDVDLEPVKGHCLLLASDHTVGLCGRERRAKTCRHRRCMKG